MNHITYVTFISFFICCVFTVSSGEYFRPTFYEISLDFSKFSPETRTFDGEARIYLNITQKIYGLQDITLDAENLTIDGISIIDSSNRKINIVKSFYNENKYIIRIKLDFDATGIVTTINYKGPVGYAGDTGVFMTDEMNIIATNSYPQGIQKIFPCVNDPSIRTSFKVNVKLVNNQWGIHHVTDGDESPAIPAHAFGFIMTLHYRKVESVSTDRFYVWVPSYNQVLYDNVNNNKILKDALAQGTYFYKFFEEATLDKIHIVMVPGIKLLSVINHRLISIRPDVIVSSQNETAEMSKATAVATLNAISKHFFRCVVSPNKWEDFWLADSLALYLQYALLQNSMFDKYNFPDLFTLELQRPAMRGSPIPVNPSSIDTSILTSNSIYPPAYQGASVLKMLEPLSSQKDILQDLFKYYQKFVYKNVDTNMFLHFMSKGSMFKILNAYGKNLQAILDKWIHDIGYPYLTDISITKDGFTVNQEKFYGSNLTSEWIIPFVYADNTNRTGSLAWMAGNRNYLYEDSNIGAWIQLNKNSKGMFRVNYGNILNELSKDEVYWSFSDVERAALIDDSFMLSWRQNPIVNFESVLHLFDKLANEKDYTSFIISMNHINVLRHLYAQMGLRSNFELKIGELIFANYESIDWFKQKSTDIGKAMWIRSVVENSCEYSVSTCQFDAGKYSSNMSSIFNDLLPTINCQIVRASLPQEWKAYFNQLYNKKSSQYARADALYSLACTNIEGGSIAVKEFLNTINSDEILLEDSLRALSYIYSRPKHLIYTLNYINSNFTSLYIRFGDDFMADLITDISKLLSPKYYPILENIQKLTSKNSKTSKAINAANGSMVTTYNIAIANLNQIAKWIHANITTTPAPFTTVPNNHENSGVNLFPCVIMLTCAIVLQIFVKV